MHLSLRQRMFCWTVKLLRITVNDLWSFVISLKHAFSHCCSAVRKSDLAEPQTHIVWWWDLLTALLAEFEKRMVWLHQCQGLNVFNMSHLCSKWRISSTDWEKLQIYPNSYSCFCVVFSFALLFFFSDVMRGMNEWLMCSRAWQHLSHWWTLKASSKVANFFLQVPKTCTEGSLRQLETRIS